MKVPGAALWAALLLACDASGGLASARATDPLAAADPSYVVQIHASRDGFVPPVDAGGEPLRTQLMTTASGQRFECYLPLSPMQRQQRALEQAAARQIAATSDDARVSGVAAEKPGDKDKYVAFARAASKKIRPMCVQYVDAVERYVYEICPGVLIRKVGLRRRPHDAAKQQRQAKRADASAGREQLQQTAAAAVPSAAEVPEATPAKAHEVLELAAFASDDELHPPVAYEEFAHGDAQSRLSAYKKPMYTQMFRARGEASGQIGDIHVQFFCSAAARDDTVAAVDWRHLGDDGDKKEPAAFAIASRLFCSAKYSDTDEHFSVGALLQPLVELHTCVKRNEGWWTYEFCFGRGIRQYHRESDGTVTAEFSLGSYDEKQNALLDASGAALVTEHVDATHDAARPAYVEAYSGGTHCKEFDVSTQRKSRVHFYCSQANAHHIMSVKETQTCTYTIKISSPVVCDHPHFITEEEQTEDKADVVHCIPVPTHDNSDLEERGATTRPPSASPVETEHAEALHEVEITATA